MNSDTAYMTDIMGGYTLTFGRHKGRTLSYVRENDRQYLSWLYQNPCGQYPEIRAFMYSVMAEDYARS